MDFLISINSIELFKIIWRAVFESFAKNDQLILQPHYLIFLTFML